MKKRRSIKIILSNRWLYTLIAIGIVLFIGVGVYAVGIKPNPGHSISELQTCDSNGQTLVMSNGVWTCGTMAQFSVSNVKITTASHNGAFGGYNAVYNWIQNNGCSGYHVCTATEVVNAAQAGLLPFSGLPYNTLAWYSSGIGTLLSDSNSNDCMGWNQQTVSYQGPAIGYYSGFPNSVYPFWSGCNTVSPVLCCK